MKLFKWVRKYIDDLNAKRAKALLDRMRESQCRS